MNLAEQNRTENRPQGQVPASAESLFLPSSGAVPQCLAKVAEKLQDYSKGLILIPRSVQVRQSTHTTSSLNEMPALGRRKCILKRHQLVR
jgi:hypothetical protein